MKSRHDAAKEHAGSTVSNLPFVLVDMMLFLLLPTATGFGLGYYADYELRANDLLDTTLGQYVGAAVGLAGGLYGMAANRRSDKRHSYLMGSYDHGFGLHD